jgi:hypothetical protein
MGVVSGFRFFLQNNLTLFIPESRTGQWGENIGSRTGNEN